MLCALMPLVKAEGDVERKSANSVLHDKWFVSDWDTSPTIEIHF